MAPTVKLMLLKPPPQYEGCQVLRKLKKKDLPGMVLLRLLHPNGQRVWSDPVPEQEYAQWEPSTTAE